MKYNGSCHCGAVKFTFEDAEPLTGVRCNCSICKRKGAVMSEHWYPAAVELAEMQLDAKDKAGAKQSLDHAFALASKLPADAQEMARARELLPFTR